jgi:hypothetical protein
MLEVRLIKDDGSLVRTANEVIPPPLVSPSRVQDLILADSGCDEEGNPLVVWKKNLDPYEVAVITHGANGKIERLEIGNKAIRDQEIEEHLLPRLINQCPMTIYSGKEGKSHALFFLSQMWRDAVRHVFPIEKGENIL